MMKITAQLVSLMVEIAAIMICQTGICIVGDATTCEVGVPHWVGDNYCDDENNNVMCGFDGGDCCNNDMANWDWYCNDCQCLG